MKKALYLFVVYIVVFVSFSLIAAYLYMQEYQLTQLVAGTKLSLFDSKLFLQGLLNYFPICGAFSILPLCFYLIKHKFRVLEYIFSYIIICCTVFFVMFPLGIFLQEKFDFYNSTPQKNLTPLSSGYFRSTPDYIDYYISINPDGSSEVLHISKAHSIIPDSQVKTKTLYQNFGDYNSFSDSIIFDVFNTNPLSSSIKQDLRFLEYKMKEAYFNGFWSFVAFMSIGLALSSVIGLKRIAKWRLLNILNLVLAFCGIIFLNVLLYSKNFYLTVSFLSPAQTWLPIVVNLVIGVVFIIIGILNSVLKLDPNRESE